MKKYRPHNAGYIVLYVLVLLSVGEAIRSLIDTARGTANELMASFNLFSYLIAALALAYLWMYVRSIVAIGDGHVHIAYPAYVGVKPGQKRAMFIFRQGENDLKFLDQVFDPKTVTRYGYGKDLRCARIDKSQANEKNKLFPVHEIVFITEDGRKYYLNIAIYSMKQRAGIVSDLKAAIGKDPEGELAKETFA